MTSSNTINNAAGTVAPTGEARLRVLLRHAQDQYDASWVRLNRAEKERNEDDIEDARRELKECGVAIKMYDEDLALLHGGMSLEDLEATADAGDMTTGMWLTLPRNDGKPDNKLGHLYGAGRMHGFDFFLPRYVGTRRDVAYMRYTYRGVLLLADALANLAAALGQANTKLDGTDLWF